MSAELSFPFIARSYINKKNPDTGKLFTKEEICNLIGIVPAHLQEWFLIISSVNEKKIAEEGRVANDEELIEAYKAVHGDKTVTRTPFGLLYREPSAMTTEKKVGDMDSLEFTALMNQILGK